MPTMGVASVGADGISLEWESIYCTKCGPQMYIARYSGGVARTPGANNVGMQLSHERK